MLQSLFPMTAPADSAAVEPVVEEIREEISQFSSLSFGEMINRLAEDIVRFAISLALAIFVFYLGKFVIKKLYRLLERVLAARSVDRSLSTFVLSLVNMVLYFILIVTVISILGINTSSFIALFASAGVAIGMALSGTLQNFAGGVLILLIKPYKVGDYIEAQGFAGTVTEIQIFNTIICTYDNKSIIIPNGGLSTGSINNWSRQDYRRVDWKVSISYGDSVDAVRRECLAMFADDPDIVTTTIAEHRVALGLQKEMEEGTPYVDPDDTPRKHGWLWRLFHTSKRTLERQRQQLDDPNRPRFAMNEEADYGPSVHLGEMADSSINVVIRAWTPTPTYWAVFYRYNERFYNELPDKAGISFPFPQLTIHQD